MAGRILDALNNMDDVESTRSAAVAAYHLSGVEGFEVPSWEALSHGLRPPSHVPEDREPGGFQHGWQHEAVSRVERHFRDRILMTRLAEHEMALLRSQSGPYAGMALSVAPASFLTRIAPALFRVLLLRRLHYLSRSACAHVAVPWIPLATIAQRVRELVCWEGAGLRWRAQRPESAARQAGGSRST